MIDLSRYVFEALRKDEEFILYRGRSKDDASGVLVLSPVWICIGPKLDRSVCFAAISLGDSQISHASLDRGKEID